MNGSGFSRPVRLARIESPSGHGLTERIRSEVKNKENTWCGASVDFRSRIKCSPVFRALRVRRTVERMTRRTNRLRRQPERVQPRTQRRRFVAEQRLGESRQHVESGQQVRVPSPKLFSFSRVLTDRGFSFPDSISSFSSRGTFCRLPRASAPLPRIACW